MPSESGSRRERPLRGPEKRVLALLGLPTFGLALAITAVTTYVPLLARQFTSSAVVIGVVIGAEGAVALVAPQAWAVAGSIRGGDAGVAAKHGDTEATAGGTPQCEERAKVGPLQAHDHEAV